MKLTVLCKVQLIIIIMLITEVINIHVDADDDDEIDDDDYYYWC